MAEIMVVFIGLFCIAFLVAGESRGLYISIPVAKVVISIILCSVVLFSYFFEAKEFIRWDLLRYRDLLEFMKEGGIEYVTERSQYVELPVANWYIFLISQVGDYHLLTAIPMMINCLVFYFIFFDVLNDRRSLNRDVLVGDVAFIVCVWIAVLSLKMAISGIRCTWAVSMAVFGVYLEYITKKKRILGYGLYIMAILTHEFALMVVIVRLLTIVKKKHLILVGVMLFFLFADMVMNILLRITESAYIDSLFSSLDEYLISSSVFSEMRRLSLANKLIYLCWWGTCVYLYIVIRCVKKEDAHCLGWKEGRIIALSETAVFAAFGLLSNKLLLERTMYFLAYVFVMILPFYMKIRRKHTLINMMAFCVLFYMFFMCDAYGFLVNYTGVYFLAH